MRSRGLPVLLIAIVAGLAAVLVAARWLQSQGGERGRVAVAATEIELGSKLTPDMVRLVEWPRTSTPSGAFSDPAKLVGRVVTLAVHPGEPILEARLAPEGSKGGLSAVVPEGKRAMTVRVNDVIGVAGFALPGTYVDIMVNTQEEGSKGNDRDRSVSKIVLERILVMAVAQEADRDSTKPKVVNAVTLEVTPEQAEMLDLARSVGTLSLVLRNQTESKLVETRGITKTELLKVKGELEQKAETTPAAASAPVKPVVRAAPRVAVRTPPKPVAVPAAPSANCVEVIRGLNRVTECFKSDDQ